jgi:hypothetical protein
VEQDGGVQRTSKLAPRGRGCTESMTQRASGQEADTCARALVGLCSSAVLLAVVRRASAGQKIGKQNRKAVTQGRGS